MNEQGQTFIEYMMTYGWAFIVLVSVIGVVMMLVAPSGDETRCIVNKPTDFLIKGVNIPHTSDLTWEGGELRLQNATGGEIDILGLSFEISKGSEACVADGKSVTCTWTEAGCDYEMVLDIGKLNSTTLAAAGSFPIHLLIGQELVFSDIDFKLTSSGTCSSLTFDKLLERKNSQVELGIQYLDRFKYARDVNVVCSNFPARPA
ncbi:MAG: hypothetical protein JW744_05390 [Candidatus Diapherotrites archaeon]|uniref:Uncharacterized protein n=1 Tax=Candidatus Iainarchaeum sp. TaxID=3101447 RepID=A0A938YXY9_9ARCH|nr:hypothetical protein [Candidatus Diapherotrites archaeon]